MLGAQLGEDAHDGRAAVLDEGARDDLERLGDGAVGPLLDAVDRLGLLGQRDRDGHLGGAAAGQQARVEDDVAGHVHGVLQVALDLVEDVLGRAPQQQRARLGVLAPDDERVVLVADLVHVKDAGAGAHVRLLELVRAEHDVGPGRAGRADAQQIREKCATGRGGVGETAAEGREGREGV